jgi:DnaJ-class molecular chaperone
MPDSFSRRFSRRFITKRIGGKLFRFAVEDSKNAKRIAKQFDEEQVDVADAIDDLNQAGLIDDKKRAFPMIVGGQTCNKCKGKGYIDDHICGYCAGIGRRTSSSYYEKI